MLKQQKGEVFVVEYHTEPKDIKNAGSYIMI